MIEDPPVQGQDAGPGDPRLKRLQQMIQQRPDLRLQRLKAMVAQQRAVTAPQKATAEAVFGEIPASSGGRDFFQTPEVTDLGDREPAFQTWLAGHSVDGHSIDPTQGQYDYRGAFNAGVEPDASGHWPDTFKQHGHPTFSNESQYSERPGEGGSWQGEKYIPAGPRVMAAKEMPTAKPGGGVGSYAKQYAVGAAGGLARVVPFVVGQTARDLARTGKAAMALAKAAGSGAAPADALDQALRGATEEYGGGGQLPGVEPIEARPRHLTGGNQAQAGGGAGLAVGSIFERGMDAANQGISSAEDFVAGKPNFTGQMGRQLGEQVGGLLPLLPAGIRAGGSMVDRVLTAAGRKRPPSSTLQRAADLMAPPEPQPIESHAQPNPPADPVPTTPLRGLADVQKDLVGARSAAMEAARRGLPTLAQEYQSHANKLMAEAKRMASQVEPIGGVPPEPPAAGQAVLKTAPERRSPQSAATPELGLYNRGAPPVLPAATTPKAEPVPLKPKPVTPKPVAPPAASGLQGMDLDQLEKEFVKLDNMPRRNPAQETRHKVLEAELDRRDQALPPVEPIEMGDAYEGPETTAAPSSTDAQALPGETPPINPKYKKLNNDQLLARRHEIMDRMEQSSKGIKFSQWSREDPNAGNLHRTGTMLGEKGDKGASGRAIGRLKDDGRIFDEINIELKARGVPEGKIADAYEAHTTARDKANQSIEAEKHKPITWPDGTVFSFPGPIKASTAAGAVVGAAGALQLHSKDETLDDRINAGIVGAVVGALGAKLGRKVVRALKVGMMTDTQWVADELIKHSNMSDAELRKMGTHMEGMLADAKKAGIAPEDFDAIEAKWRDAIEQLGEKPPPPEKATVVLPKDIWKFPDQKGAAPAGTIGTLAGAGVGAVAGAASSDKENKIGGALTGALAGAYAGHILTRAVVARGAKSVFQKTVNDPDVAAVLSAAAQPRKGPLRTFAGLKAAIVEHARSSYQAMLDDVYAARRFGREVGKTEKVSDEASRARGWRGFGDELIGRTERWKQKMSIFSNLPTLRKAVQASKGHEAEVIALSWAERAIELEDAGMDWKLYGHATRQQAEATVKKLGVIPEARKGADQLRAFYDYLYELRYKNGLIGKAEYLATKAKHQQYVSFLRDFGNEQGVNAGSAGGKLYMRGSTVKKMEAGIASSPIVDPFEQAASDAYRVARAVSRQRVFNAISEIVAKDPAGAAPWIKDFGLGTKGVPRGYEGRTIQARVNGELHLYGIEDYDFYNALSAIAPETHDIAHYLLTLPKKTLQAGTTIVPSFGAANASRDAFFTSLAYDFPVRAALAGAAVGGTVGALADKEHPLEGAEKGAGLGLGVGMMAVHGARLAKAFGHIVKNDDIYQIWKRGGGSGSGMFVRTKQDAEQAIAALRHDHVTPYDLINPKTWWEALENFNRMIEEMPRLAKFEHDVYKKGKPVATGIANSRGVSLDFSRHGGSDIARLGRETSAFWNPKLQGLDKMREVFRQPKTYAMGIATMTAPTVALWMINKDDPEYQKRPLYEKMIVWHIPVGKDDRGVTQYFLLPKPFEPGYVFASLPQLLLDFAYRRDKERTMAGLGQIASSVGQGLLPIPTAAQPIMENQAGPQGWSSFRGRPIVDDALAKLPAREQIDSRTSTVAIALSRAAELGTFGGVQMSPKKVDNVIQGWFGKGGRVASSQIDAILQQSGASKRPVAPARNTSQWSRFVSQEAGFNTDDIQTLFRQYDDASKHLEQVKRLMKEGLEKEAQTYAKTHRADLITARMYARAIERYRDIARGRRQIENSRSLSADEKRKQIADLGEQASALAKAYVDARLKLVQGAAK